MPRVKRGVTARARHKKVLALAKGFRGRRGNVFRIAKQAVMKAGQYAYRDRRNKKRVFRQLWIARINAASRSFGLTYSQFGNGLKKAASRSTARCSPTWPSMTAPLSAPSWPKSRPSWQLELETRRRAARPGGVATVGWSLHKALALFHGCAPLPSMPRHLYVI